MTDEKIVFFGSNEYVPLLLSLKAGRSNRKTLFYNTAPAAGAAGAGLGTGAIRNQDQDELAL